MNLEMRKRLAREPFPDKIRKAGQLIALAKTFRRRSPKGSMGNTSPSEQAPNSSGSTVLPETNP